MKDPRTTRTSARKMPATSRLRVYFANLLSLFRGATLKQSDHHHSSPTVSTAQPMNTRDSSSFRLSHRASYSFRTSGSTGRSGRRSSLLAALSILRKSTSSSTRRKRASNLQRATADSSSWFVDSTEGSFPPPPALSTTPRPRHALTRRRSSAPITPNTSVRRKTYLSNERLTRTLARDSILRRSFEEFAADQYAAENVAFMEEIFDWRTNTPGDLERAKKICEMYIYEGSPLQVNISWFSRVSVEKIMEETMEELDQVVPVDVFERAADEITTMMRGGVWMSFVRRGGCDRALSVSEPNEAQARVSTSSGGPPTYERCEQLSLQ